MKSLRETIAELKEEAKLAQKWEKDLEAENAKLKEKVEAFEKN